MAVNMNLFMVKFIYFMKMHIIGDLPKNHNNKSKKICDSFICIIMNAEFTIYFFNKVKSILFLYFAHLHEPKSCANNL